MFQSSLSPIRLSLLAITALALSLVLPAYTVPAFAAPRSLPANSSLYVFDQAGGGLFEVSATGESTELFGEIEMNDLDGNAITEPKIENGFFNLEDNRIYFVETNTFLLAAIDVLTGNVDTIAQVSHPDTTFSTPYDPDNDDIFNPYGLGEYNGTVTLLADSIDDLFDKRSYFLAELDLETGVLSNEIALPEPPEAFGLTVSRTDGTQYIMGGVDDGTNYLNTIQRVNDTSPSTYTQVADLGMEPADFLWSGGSDSSGVLWFQETRYGSGVNSSLYSFDPDTETVELQGQLSGDSYGTGITIVGLTTQKVQELTSSQQSTSTTRSNNLATGTPGTYLTVTGKIGEGITNEEILYGAYSAGQRAPFTVILRQDSAVATSQIIASGALNATGNLEDQKPLPRLTPGTYTIIFTSTGAAGQTLRLGNTFTVDSDGSLSSRTAEERQPLIF